MQDPGMAGQRQSLAMLHHHAACRPEETAGAEMGEHFLSDVSPVRRNRRNTISKGKCPSRTRQASRKLFLSGWFPIAPNRRTRGCLVSPGSSWDSLQRKPLGGAATEGLDPDGSGSRIEIQEAGSFDLGGEDVEEGLPDPAGGRTKKRAAGERRAGSPAFLRR
jgi:hypothetical protein